MLRGILIIAAVGLLAVLSHRRSRFEERVFKNVPLSDWFTILVIPLFMYLGWITVVRNILERPTTALFPLDDYDILTITILFLVYSFVGNSIHFTAKILWRYLKDYESTLAYQVNEMFHGKLSHYLTYLNGIFIIFLLAVLEINHPLLYPVLPRYSFMVIVSGIVFGVSGSKAVFYTNEWFGGYNKPLFFLVTILFAVLISMLKFFRLPFRFYPVNLFVFSMFLSFLATFLLRQVFIFAKLSDKKKLGFLTKILHA